MMSNDERLATLLDSVLESIQPANERFGDLMSSLTTHLHAFVREARPTAEEWFAGLDFLLRTGQMCSPLRNEYILLSDMLGLTSAVDEANHFGPESMTPSSVEGPFHSLAPRREMGDWIADGPERERGEPVLVQGVVSDCDGVPIGGALLDIWQANDVGLYDSQDPSQTLGNLRALLVTGSDGRYHFRTVKPSSYPVPTDGPGGEILRAMGRHPMRPAHWHIQVTAKSYRPLTTHLFIGDDPYLYSDAAFAVKPELLVNLVAVTDAERAGSFGEPTLPLPYWQAGFDIRLVDADWAAESTPELDTSTL